MQTHEGEEPTPRGPTHQWARPPPHSCWNLDTPTPLDSDPVPFGSAKARPLPADAPFQWECPLPTDLPWKPVSAGREAGGPGLLPVRPGHPPGWGCACTAPVWGTRAGGVEASCPVLSSRQPRALFPALRPPLQGPFSHSRHTLPGLEMGHC